MNPNRVTPPSVLLACLLLCASCAPPPDEAAGGDAVRDLTFYLRRLRQLDHLPTLERAHTAMASTWDRTGGNKDGDDYKRVEGDRNVLLDVDGPGCIHRLFTGLLGDWVEGTRIQIFIDRASEPLFDQPVADFFSEAKGPFPYPLTRAKTYPGTFFPIPYSDHVRVQLLNSAKQKNWGLYWQITYSSYAEGTRVESLRWPPDTEERQAIGEVLSTWLLASSLPPEAPERWTVDRALELGPGQGQEIALQGSGVIQQLRVRVSPDTAAARRGLRLRMRWDGATAASVDVPLGYFFGHGDVQAASFSSLLLGVSEGEAFARFPMPFAAGARVSLVNASYAGTARVHLRLAVQPRPGGLPAHAGRFHATWSQRPAAAASAPRFGPQQVPGHVVLERTGRGKYIGALIHLQWPHQWAWWGEGDWLIWSDESGWPPSYHGTGSEEYFNSGWMFLERRPVSGFVKMRPGAVAAYSFHLNDAFQFASRIKVVEETVGSFGGDLVIDQQNPLWGSTAFWYAPSASAAGSTAAAPR